MEKKSGQKLCNFKEIYNIRKPEDIPNGYPSDRSIEWRIDFYTHCLSLMKEKEEYKDKYERFYKMLEYYVGKQNETE